MATQGDGGNPFSTVFDQRAAEVMEHFHVAGLSISVINGDKTFAKVGTTAVRISTSLSTVTSRVRRCFAERLSSCHSQNLSDDTQGYGKASLKDNRPATPDTLYYTGSTTKAFAAAATLKVIESGEGSNEPLKLQTKIASIIREDFVLQDDYATQHLTLEDALCHRTGMPRHDMAIGGPRDDLQKVVRRLRHLPMFAELRQKYQYCNLMFLVVGYCLEKLTSMSLGQYLRDNFWTPLDMTSTFFSRAEAEAHTESESDMKLATPYYWSDEERVQVEAPNMIDTPVHGAAGAMISNVMDYAKWLRAMIQQDKRILNEKSFTELRTPRITIVFEGQPKAFTGPEMYGLGWRSAVYQGHQAFYHGGTMIGFSTQIMYIPTLADGVGIAIMSNGEFESYFAINVLLYDVLHNIMDMPQEKRFDWLGYWSKHNKERVEKLYNSAGAIKDIYPAMAADSKMSLPLPLSAYAGTYQNPGYRTVMVKLVDHGEKTDHGGSSMGQLRVEARQQVWLHDLEFEHVSSNYFLAWMRPPGGLASGSFFNEAMAAEFTVNAGRKVSRLGIAYEPALGGKLTWFERVESKIS